MQMAKPSVDNRKLQVAIWNKIDKINDNFANDYIEAVNVATTNNDVKEMLTLLEAKNKQLPKDLIISVDENEITIKEKEVL